MKVKIYSTPMCHFCHMTKDFLNENKVEFEDINVATDQKAAEEMVKKSGQMGVPVIAITKDDGQEELLVGFQEQKLREILNIK
jgi:glutaredoxin 3